MSVNAYLYSSIFPFERRAWLRTATGIGYAFELMTYGRFQFDLCTADALTSAQLAPGSLVGFKSTGGVPDFLGWIDRVEESHGGSYVTVSGREWAAILSERSTLQERTYYSGAAATIGGDIVRQASGRNPTGIDVIPTGLSGPLSSPFTVRAAPVLDVLTDLADITGTEWQMQYTVGPTARAQLYWNDRAGRDEQESIHLAGPMIADADYDFDLVSDRAIVGVIGSSGVFGDRPSAAAVDAGPLALQDTALVRVAAVADPSRRQVQRRGIATSREAVILDSALPDRLAVQRRAVETLRALVSGAETLSVTVTQAADWTRLRTGNIVTVRLPGVRFGDHLVRAFRIFGIQPREERGVMELVGKVLPNAA